MKTMSKPFSSNTDNSSSPKLQKQGYQFWGVTLSNIPSSSTESSISTIFKKYGDIFSIKSTAPSTMRIIFKSPKNNITDIINEQTRFKVTPIESKQFRLFYFSISTI